MNLWSKVRAWGLGLISVVLLIWSHETGHYWVWLVAWVVYPFVSQWSKIKPLLLSQWAVIKAEWNQK
jgi:hypothetical protein